MATIETGGSQSAKVSGAARDARGAPVCPRPAEAGPQPPAASLGAKTLKSPDPMAVTDRYNLATPYTSSSLDL